MTLSKLKLLQFCVLNKHKRSEIPQHCPELCGAVCSHWWLAGNQGGGVQDNKIWFSVLQSSAAAELRLSVSSGAFPALFSWGCPAEMQLGMSHPCSWECPKPCWVCRCCSGSAQHHCGADAIQQWLHGKSIPFVLGWSYESVEIQFANTELWGCCSPRAPVPGLLWQQLQFHFPWGRLLSFLGNHRSEILGFWSFAGSGPSCLMAHLFPSQWSRELLLHQVSGYSCSAVITLVRK